MSRAAANPNEPEGSMRRLGWLLVSLAFHAALITGLICTIGVSPESKRTPLETMTATTASDRIEQVVEDVRRHEAEEVSQKVEDLHQMEEELAKLDREKISEYKALATELTQDAPSDIKQEQSEAATAQKRALEAQNEADAALEQASAAEKDAAAASAEAKPQAGERIRGLQKHVVDAQENALRAQKAASAAQAAVAETLAFVDAGFKDAAGVQRDAIQAQADAKAAQDKAKDAQQGPVNDAENRVRAQEEQLLPVVRKLAEEEEKTAAAAKVLAAADAALEDAGKRVEEQEAALEEARTSDAEVSVPDAEKSVRMASVQRETAKKADDRARQIQTSEQNTLASVKGDLDRKQNEETARRAEAAQKQLDALSEQAAADSAQRKATELQTRAEAAAAAIASETAVGAPKSEAIAEAVARTQVLPLESELQNKALGNLYDTAAASEKNAAEIFRELRAAETATLRRIPLDEARRSTDVVQPLRNPIDKELLSKEIRTPAEARDHAQAVRAAVQEIDSMVSLARDLVREAKAEQNPGASITLDSMKSEATQNAELEKQAAQDYGQQARDLSEIMRSMERGSSEGDAQRGAMQTALAALLPLATLNGDAALTAQILSAIAALKNGGGAGARSGGGLAGAARKPGGGGPPSSLQANGHTLPAIPGRKILKGAPPSDWMFVDSWWIIGPFPNPNRRNIEERFPPESVLDLDASYSGKDHKKVKWQFVQSPHARVWPPDDEEYQIYYAYTELWFEEACDRWIAVGSDDYSKLWLEGMLVWKSGDQLKGWNIDEGYRKVHFKKGLNRVLYRVENGWHSTQFSLCICLKDDRG